MESTEILLSVSVNPRLKNKNDLNDRQALKEGFENVELTPNQLCQLIHLGAGFSYQYFGTRNSKNFSQTNMVGVDIDGAHTLEETLDNPFVSKNLTFFYTTPSHTAENHRFRLIFALPRTITDPLQIKALAKALARKLGGDQRFTDAARIYYGSEGCQFKIWNRVMDSEDMESMIQEGLQESTYDGSSIFDKNSTANLRSGYLISPDTPIKLVNGSEAPISSLKGHTPCYCPFHDDSNASAFVVSEPKVGIRLTCISNKCNKTWWVRGSKYFTYNFNDFEESAVNISKLRNKNNIESAITPLNKQLSHLQHSRINIINSEKFVLPSLNKGITLIKSPKGSGKTTTLPKVLEKLIKIDTSKSILEFIEENQDPDYPPINPQNLSSYSILLMGHRQALIRDLCNKLNLNCYLDDDLYSESDNNTRRKRYGICLDSLPKISRLKYDIVILDEIEQVLAHFLSSTLEKQREKVFRYFSELIKNASYVIGLDADLSWVSYNTLIVLTNTQQISNDPNKQVWIYINQYKSKNDDIEIFANENHLEACLIEELKAGERIYVATNSKAKAEKLALLCHDIFGSSDQIMLATSDTVKKANVKYFINNIKQEILKYRVVIASPTLGTGLDITFQDEGQELVVYGFFYSSINNHFDIDQQLLRVRHPIATRVWISPQQFSFETDSIVINEDLLKSSLVANTFIGFTPEGEEAYDKSNPIIPMASLITSRDRASKNFLKQNFINYKIEQGYQILQVAKNDDLAKQGSAFDSLSKRLKEEDLIDRLMNGKPLDQGNYLRIAELFDENDAVISEADQASFARMSIEQYYRQPISPNLIKQDKSGKLKKYIHHYSNLTDRQGMNFLIKKHKFDLPSETRKPRLVSHLIQDPEQRLIALYECLIQTPFFQNGEFNFDCVYSAEDLVNLVRHIGREKAFIEKQLNINIRPDYEKKIVQQTSELLKPIGLTQNRLKTKTINGKKNYYYQVAFTDGLNLDEIIERRRLIPKPWPDIHQRYGFESALYERKPHQVCKRSGELMYTLHYWSPVTEGTVVELNKTKKIQSKFGNLDDHSKSP